MRMRNVVHQSEGLCAVHGQSRRRSDRYQWRCVALPRIIKHGWEQADSGLKALKKDWKMPKTDY